MTRWPPALPAFVEDLEDMAVGDPGGFRHVRFPRDPARAKKVMQDRFEDAVCRALELAGLHTNQMGHTRAAQEDPDGISVFYGEKTFALIVDAKVAANGYRLPSKDRRALESYIRKWDQRLLGGSGGYQEIHVLIVSSKFPDDLSAKVEKIRTGCQNTRFGRVLLLSASALRALVKARLSDARLGVTFYNTLLQSGDARLTPEMVERARKETLRLASHT